ncbi:MAG: alpha-amylase family glycosyl hydrolase [Bacteroidales bacterium]
MKTTVTSPNGTFRLGQGVSARLADLFHRDPRKIGLAFSVMLSLPGTPIIYYGDEFGKLNDHDYYKEMIRLSGKDDTRFLVRGKVDWKQLENDLKESESLASLVYDQTKTLLNVRKNHPCFEGFN